MNRTLRHTLRAALLLATIALASVAAQAQAFVSQPATTNVSYNVAEILTVTTDTPTLALTTTQQPIAVTTTWQVQSNRTTLATIAYFQSANPLTGPQGSVASVDILGQGQDSEAPCTQSSSALPGYPGTSVGNNVCGYVFSAGGAVVSTPGTRTNIFKIRISPTATYAPGTYSGVLYFISACD